MENLQDPLIAVAIGLSALIVFVVTALIWRKHHKTSTELTFNSAKDVLKFSPIEAEFAVILRYRQTSKNVITTTKNIDYYISESRKVFVTFDFSSIIETKNRKTKTISLSHLPEPLIEIDKKPLRFTSGTLKNKNGVFNVFPKNKEVDTDIVLKVRKKAVKMVYESALESGIKEIAQKKLSERIGLLQNAAAVKKWQIKVEQFN